MTTVDTIKLYLRQIPEGAKAAWIQGAYEIYLEDHVRSGTSTGSTLPREESGSAPGASVIAR
jgi:hypothetical protein